MTSKQPGFVACAAGQMLLPAALLVPPSKLAHVELAALFLPIILACDVYAWSRGLGAIVAVHLLWTFELLVFRNPRENFQIIHRRSKQFRALSQERKAAESVWKEPFPEALVPRVWWVMKVITSVRFIGIGIGGGENTKTYQASSPTENRGCWLLRKLAVAVACFLILDATASYQLFDPYFLGQADIDSPLPRFLPVGLSLSTLTPRFVRMLLFGLQQYSTFSIVHDVSALIWVSLGGLGLVDDWWGGCQNWPNVMGNPLVIFESGLRGFWGKFWHQLFRRMFVDPGKFLARVMEIPERSIASYAIQIVVAFSLSSAVHAFSLPRDIPGINIIRYSGFFWIHGLCVILEIIASLALRTMTSQDLTARWPRLSLPALRAVWALGVLYGTVPLIGSELVKVMVAVDLRPVALFPTPQNGD